MAELAELQYQLDTDGLLFGRGTPITVAAADFGAAEVAVADTDRSREDGQRFGRDFYSARTITFDMTVLTRGSALPTLDELAAAWRADAVRSTPGAVLALRHRRGGRTRRTFGRPRRFAPTAGATLRGLVPVVADFRTVDHLFYDDAELTSTVSITEAAQGGLVLPLRPPLVLSGSGSGRAPVQVGGTESTWLVSAIHGPILNPTVQVVDQWSITLLTSIAAGQTVVVDPRPWKRTVTGSDGSNLAGAFTADSQRLSLLRIPPGTHEVILRGQDPTGTASLTTFWRAAWSSF